MLVAGQRTSYFAPVAIWDNLRTFDARLFRVPSTSSSPKIPASPSAPLANAAVPTIPAISGQSSRVL